MTPSAADANDKAVLRRAMLLELQAMSSHDRAKRSEKICARVVESLHWQTAKRMVLFSPLRTEPQIAPLETAAVAAAREVFIIPPTLRQEAELELPFVPDFILVPGLVFTRAGRRLGRGGGFYDRLLAGRARGACKLGVCFALQLRDRIPHEPHDAVVDLVISD